MTKKHFIALADKIKWGYLSQWSQWHLEQLADFLEEQYPKFDRKKWLTYVRK